MPCSYYVLPFMSITVTHLIRQILNYFTAPLPASSVQIWNGGHPNRLHVAWASASGRLDGYELKLYYTGSSTLATQAHLGRDATNFTYSGLTPGINYLSEILSKAGPHRTSAGNFSAWTSE